MASRVRAAFEAQVGTTLNALRTAKSLANKIPEDDLSPEQKAELILLLQALDDALEGIKRGNYNYETLRSSLTSVEEANPEKGKRPYRSIF